MPLEERRACPERSGARRELLRTIIQLQKTPYVPTITEEAMRISNQFQKPAGVVKGDFAYDKAVAVQFKAAG